MAQRAVFCAQPVDGGAKAARARAVEVGDLYNTHTVTRRGARVHSTMWAERVPEQSMNSAAERRLDIAISRDGSQRLDVQRHQAFGPSALLIRSARSGPDSCASRNAPEVGRLRCSCDATTDRDLTVPEAEIEHMAPLVRSLLRKCRWYPATEMPCGSPGCGSRPPHQ